MSKLTLKTEGNTHVLQRMGDRTLWLDHVSA